VSRSLQQHRFSSHENKTEGKVEGVCTEASSVTEWLTGLATNCKGGSTVQFIKRMDVQVILGISNLRWVKRNGDDGGLGRNKR